MAQHPTPKNIMELGLGFWGSKVALSAIELGLFTILAKKPQSGKALAAAGFRQTRVQHLLGPDAMVIGIK